MRKSSSESFPHTFFSVFLLLCAYRAHLFLYQVRTPLLSSAAGVTAQASFLQLLLVRTSGTTAPCQPQPQAADVQRLTWIRYKLPKLFPHPSGIFSANFLLRHARILPGLQCLGVLSHPALTVHRRRGVLWGMATQTRRRSHARCQLARAAGVIGALLDATAITHVAC